MLDEGLHKARSSAARELCEGGKEGEWEGRREGGRNGEREM